MAIFKGKYKELVERLEAEKNEKVEQLKALQAEYNEITGSYNSEINEKIENLESTFSRKWKQMGIELGRFREMMARTDIENRAVIYSDDLTNSKHRSDMQYVNQLTDDEVYSRTNDAQLRMMIRRRSSGKGSAAMEAFYVDALFAPKKEITEQQQENLEVMLEEPEKNIEITLPATVSDPFIMTTSDLLAKNGNRELAERIKKEVEFIQSKVGEVYDLFSLTPEELTNVAQGMREFQSLNAEEKIQAFIPYLTAFWAKDYELKKYTLKRHHELGLSAVPNTRSTRKRLEKVAAEVLRMRHSKFKDRFTSPYRHHDIKIGAEIEATDNYSQILWMEEMLARHVIGKRETIYAKASYDTMQAMLKVHNTVAAALDSEEMDALNIRYQVDKMRDLSAYYKENDKLTSRQREFAFDLLTQYAISLQAAPNAVKEKIAAAIAKQEEAANKNESQDSCQKLLQ